MANVLRYQTGSSRFRPFVGGLEPIDEDAMPAPPNASGILERNVVPGAQTDTTPGGQGEYQLDTPGDLRLPEREATPTLDRLTMRASPNPRLEYGPRQFSMVEGLPQVEPEPEPEMAQAMRPPNQPRDRDADDRRRIRQLDRAQAVGNLFGRLSQLSQGRDTPPIDFSQMPMGERQWSDVPRARIEERHATMDEGIEGKVAGAQAAEDREYQRQFGDRRMQLEERRIAQAEGATSQDIDRSAAMYSPEHPAAQSARIAYARLYRAVPPSARPQLSSFEPDASMRGMSAMDLRQQSASLMQAWARLQQANPRLFQVGRRSVGGSPRGTLAGLGGRRHTVDRGTSEGLTAEDFATLGIDPAQFGMEPAPAVEGAEALPPEAATPAEAPLTRPRGAAPSRPQGARPAMHAPAPQAGQAPPPAGRPLLDRPMTRGELDQASPDVRRTQLLALAEQRRHLGTPWRDAVGVVSGMRDVAQDELLRDWGSEHTDRIPNWQRVRDVPLTPQALNNMREAVTQARTVRAASQRIIDLTNQINALNLAEDVLVGHPLVARWRSESRRIQTALRKIDETGVPTGDEQERAMQEAPEPRNAADVRSLLRSSVTYRTLPDVLGANLGIYMQQNGYAPVRRQQGAR